MNIQDDNMSPKRQIETPLALKRSPQNLSISTSLQRYVVSRRVWLIIAHVINDRFEFYSSSHNGLWETRIASARGWQSKRTLSRQAG
jgi:hypothetical protein